MKIAAKYFRESTINFYTITMRSNPEESNVHIHLRGNITSDKMATPPTDILLSAKSVFWAYCGTKE
jgi:hypothetical protein